MEVSGQLHAPAALPPGKEPVTHWIGGWVGPRAVLDAVVKRNGAFRGYPQFSHVNFCNLKLATTFSLKTATARNS